MIDIIIIILLKTFCTFSFQFQWCDIQYEVQWKGFKMIFYVTQIFCIARVNILKYFKVLLSFLWFVLFLLFVPHELICNQDYKEKIQILLRVYHLSVVDEVITIKSVLWLMSWIAWNIIINFWNRSKILSGFNFAKGFKFLPRAIEYGATRVQQIQLNFLRSK